MAPSSLMNDECKAKAERPITSYIWPLDRNIADRVEFSEFRFFLEFKRLKQELNKMSDETTITPEYREKICRAVSDRSRYIDYYINEIGSRPNYDLHKALDALRPHLRLGDVLKKQLEIFLLRVKYPDLPKNSPTRWLDRNGVLVYDHSRPTQEPTMYGECPWFLIM